MASTTIQVRLPLSKLKARLAQLPGIITGRLPDPFRLRPLFFAVIARSLFRSIYEAFKLKSLGGTDNLGASWRGLKPSTKKRRLAPSLLSRFPLSAQLYILRVSDTLYDSLKPGSIAGSQYRPAKNQLYELTTRALELGTTVNYAEYVNRRRPLWPARIARWIQSAISEALGVVCELYVIRMAREV